MIALVQSATFVVAAAVAIGSIAATVIPTRKRIVDILRARGHHQQVSHG